MANQGSPRCALAPLLLVLLGLSPIGCGGDSAPPQLDSEQFQEVKKEREDIIRKEYGSTGGPAAKKRR